MSLVLAKAQKYQSLLRDMAILASIAVLVRLPYFCQTVIHWHESTYILLGQDILSGHLPQTVLSELKPSFAALPYAVFIALFGKSIAAIRLGGLVSVFLSSFIVYLPWRL